MDKKETLYSHATYEFDKCLEKYSNKVKNCLYGMIYHAYNEGRKDGLKEKTTEALEKAYSKGLEDMLEAMKDFYYSEDHEHLRPSALTEDEMEYYFGGYTLGFVFKYRAKKIIEIAKEVHEKRKKKAQARKVQIGDFYKSDDGDIFVVKDIIGEDAIVATFGKPESRWSLELLEYETGCKYTGDTTKAIFTLYNKGEKHD